ncbi:hypothetical protein FGO68_gene6113 [Halteria grandinella]|uniref:UBC core domain-containing protein n=1 Tax=Halteria grandinella TaxID=5974 RepID=A0A8J8P2Y9_HALGN|nr:hypothetical protein FGO68_gene6113 [Halteria grandinella]
MNLQGVTRLQKEYKQLSTSTSVQNFVAVPDSQNIFEWHYCIYGLLDSPYEGGFYHGKLIFPTEYPMKPPSILMITPSGRFQEKTRICLSISDFHPETWNPIWKVETIMTALVSFMNSDENSTGCVASTSAQKREYARASLRWNVERDGQEGFVRRFESFFAKMGINEETLQEREKKIEQSRKEEDDGNNFKNFLIMAGIAIVVSAIIAYRMSSGEGLDKEDVLEGATEL